MQHVYAAIFAGSITFLLTAVILYFDYGFWHEKYRRDEVLETKSALDPMGTVQSPGEMIGSFFKEASIKLKEINLSGTNLLEGKDVYTKDVATTTDQ